MASVLRELGLRPGDRVFVLLGRGVTLHATLLGIVRAGMVAARFLQRLSARLGDIDVSGTDHDG